MKLRGTGGGARTTRCLKPFMLLDLETVRIPESKLDLF